MSVVNKSEICYIDESLNSDIWRVIDKKISALSSRLWVLSEVRITYSDLCVTWMLNFSCLRGASHRCSYLVSCLVQLCWITRKQKEYISIPLSYQTVTSHIDINFKYRSKRAFISHVITDGNLFAMLKHDWQYNRVRNIWKSS